MERRSHSSNFYYSLNQSSRLEENMGTFERNTRQRTNPGAEQNIQFSSMSSSSNVGSTSQFFHTSYWMSSSSGSASSIPPTGSDALWQEDNSRYIARSTSVQTVLVPNPEMGITSQNVMASSAFPVYYSSQNGFAGAVHLSTTPRFPQMNLVEEYEEGLSNFLQPVILSHVDSMMRAEGHNAAVPSIVPALEQFSAERALLATWEILQEVDGTALQYEDDMTVGPMFHEPDMHEDMHFDVDNMSYEELLALEDEMGTVNTGLSEVAILDVLKQHSYQSMKLGLPVEEEPCCVCREEYVDGEELGKLDCGHEFHFNCIKQWLMQKNSCPICKRTALTI